MKILYLSRSDLYKVRGGDTFQMEKTKEAIERLDPTVKIDISTDVNPSNIDDYDILHLFNLDWICETYLQAKNAKKHAKKLVLSAIHHSEIEVKKYEDLAQFDIRRIYNNLIRSQPQRDAWKNIYRSLLFHEKLYPSILQLKMGIRNQQREIIKMSDMILVQTEAEAKSIQSDFGVLDFKYEKVVNGVDPHLFYNSNPQEFNDLVRNSHGVDISNIPIILNVGRIEPRKNQIKLIEAYDQLKKENDSFKNHLLVFVGDLTNKSFEYKLRFKSMIKNRKDIIYVSGQPQVVVASAMSHKGIYVHTSWFETTALVCLEALLAGMPVVSTSTRLKEYVGDHIEYCDPQKATSIKNAILAGSIKQNDMESVKNLILTEYTWEQTAKQTLSVYKCLNK